MTCRDLSYYMFSRVSFQGPWSKQGAATLPVQFQFVPAHGRPIASEILSRCGWQPRALMRINIRDCKHLETKWEFET